MKKYWIKKRHNPQLGIYYVAEGQMTKTKARSHEQGSVYGSNEMLPFDSEESYLKHIARLKSQGARFV